MSSSQGSSRKRELASHPRSWDILCNDDAVVTTSQNASYLYGDGDGDAAKEIWTREALWAGARRHEIALLQSCWQPHIDHRRVGLREVKVPPLYASLGTIKTGY